MAVLDSEKKKEFSQENTMKNLICLFMILILYSPIMYAEITRKGQYFKSLCIEDLSVGFNWRNRGWEQTTFRKVRYLVNKIRIEMPKDPRSVKYSGMCNITLFNKIRNGTRENIWQVYKNYEKDNFAYEKKIYGSLDFLISFGCYNIRRFGEPYYSNSSELCNETWEKSYGDNFKLKRVECISSNHNFIFEPDGNFHESLIHGDLNNYPQKDYKDSLSMSVGKCGVTTLSE